MEAGRRRIGFALPDDDRLLAFSTPRLQGATRACTENGLAKPVALTVPLDATSAAESVRRWMAEEPRITAVCAYNDEVGLAVLAGMRKHRLTAPHDLAVIGVDDIPAARLSTPALTTVATGMAVFGEHLADLVSGALQGKQRPPRPTGSVLHVIKRETA